jgi:hypothetical protein
MILLRLQLGHLRQSLLPDPLVDYRRPAFSSAARWSSSGQLSEQPLQPSFQVHHRGSFLLPVEVDPKHPLVSLHLLYAIHQF